MKTAKTESIFLTAVFDAPAPHIDMPPNYGRVPFLPVRQAGAVRVLLRKKELSTANHTKLLSAQAIPCGVNCLNICLPPLLLCE